MRPMSKLLTTAALAVGLMLPTVSMAQSNYNYDYNDDYNYDSYDYNYDYNDYYNSYDYDYDYDSGASTALGVGLMVVAGIFGLIGLAFFIFEIIMIIDCVKRDFENRTVWLVVLIAGLFFGFGWIAAIIYYFTVKRKNLGKAHATHTGTTPPPTAPMQQ